MAATLTEFMNNACNIIETSARVILSDVTSVDTLERNASRLNELLRNTRRVSTRYPQVERLSSIIVSIIAEIEEQKSNLSPESGYVPPLQQNPRGRPRYVVTQDQLLYMTRNGFNTRQMAQMLHVSQAVVKRRLRLYGIRIRHRYSDLSDTELDEHVGRIIRGNPSLGQRMVQGILQADGLSVQRSRIAGSLLRVNEADVAMRWARTIQRRVYRVSSPNALWHIDGNHKLIRWGFIIHGGIDGFSRLNVFLRVAVNNKSETMMEAFNIGIQKFGIPSRVRADHGLENTDVGAFMIAYRGPGRGSFITGQSVHNQRIERLWRDVFQFCTSVFHNTFSEMEQTGELDITNNLHVWCLHYVFLSRIQQALDSYQGGWNNHRVRTEGGKTPMQLFIQGIFRHVGSEHRGIDDLFYEPPLEPLPEAEEEYGPFRENLSTDAEIEENTIDLPSITPPISDEDFQRLQNTVNPLDDNHSGSDLYKQAVEFCRSAIR